MSLTKFTEDHDKIADEIIEALTRDYDIQSGDCQIEGVDALQPLQTSLVILAHNTDTKKLSDFVLLLALKLGSWICQTEELYGHHRATENNTHD